MDHSRYLGRRVRKNQDNSLNHFLFIEDTQMLIENESQSIDSCEDEEDWDSPSKKPILTKKVSNNDKS